MKINVNMYKSSGVPTKLTRFEFVPDQIISLPDDTTVLHSELFMEGDSEYLVLYAAVPQSSVLGKDSREVNIMGHAIPTSQESSDDEQDDPTYDMLEEEDDDVDDFEGSSSGFWEG